MTDLCENIILVPFVGTTSCSPTTTLGTFLKLFSSLSDIYIKTNKTYQ